MLLTLQVFVHNLLAKVAAWLLQFHWSWILLAFLGTMFVMGTVVLRLKEAKRPTRDYQYLRTYEQSLENKRPVKVNLIHCMTVGPPHVGKTTLKNQLLTGQSKNKRQCKRRKRRTVMSVINGSNTSSKRHTRPPSTPVMTSIERIEIPVKSNSTTSTQAMLNKNTWKTISLDDKFITYLKMLTFEEAPYKQFCVFCTLCIFIMSILLFLIPLIHGEHVLFALFHPFLFYLCLTCCIVLLLVTAIVKKASSTVHTVVRKVVNTVGPKKLRAKFDETETLLITISDCGGQPEFHEVLPALVSHSTLFLLMFNLDKGLDRQYEVTYKANDDEISDPYMSSFTVRQSLLQCLASIKSIGSYSYSKPRPSLISRIWHRLTFRSSSVLPWEKNLIDTTSNTIVIGTHKDLLMDRQAPIKEIQRTLEREIKRTDWYTSDMIVPTPGRHLVLAIDTFDQTDINTVKEMISGSVLNRELEVPVPWLALELCIQKLNKPVMSLEEIQKLASECNIKVDDGNEFQAVLWFLHHVMGTIRYFENVPEIRNTVITNPQLLFDLVTELIVKTFSFANLKSLHQYEQFNSSGFFVKQHLKKCKAVKKRLLTEEQIISLLQHLNIIAPVGVTDEGEREYFLPCVLVHATLPSSSHRSITLVTAVAAPLLITFKCQYTPRGIFSCLIAHILRTSQGQWKLASDKIYRNQVEFHHVDSGHLVLIRNFFQFLEVTLKLSHGTIISIVPFAKIQQFLTKCLEEVRDQLNYSSTAVAYTFGFYCSQDHTSTAAAAEPHPAVCVTDATNPHTVCSIDSTTANLTPKQAIWFNNDGDTSSLGNLPAVLCIEDLNTVVEVLNKEHFDVTKWRRLGLRLGLYDTRLKEIQSDNRLSIDCLYSCLSDWLRQVDKVKKVGIPTWVALATALKSVGEPRIADCVQAF